MVSDDGPAAKIGVLWRGDPGEPPPDPGNVRLARIFEALTAHGAEAEPVLYADREANAIRERLLRLDGVLVWVDPIVGGYDRSTLDSVLREIARAGVFVSAHPDVILKMGTKEALVQTRGMPWGTDTHLFRDADELAERLPPLLRLSRPRVLKQNRGSGGNGVWKVELVSDASPVELATVRVQHAARGGRVEEISLGEFLHRCQEYFAAFSGAGRIIDQPYQERLVEGMVRCYLTQDRVVGFGHQFVTALVPPPPGTDRPPDPQPRVYFGPAKPEYQRLKRFMESGWVAEMRRLLEIPRDSLPVIWDADFLLGPKTPSGDDTYVLCEINVSGVFPIPDESAAPLATAAVERTLFHKRLRRI